MTNREFFVSISAGNLTEDCIAHATEALSKMDAANEKRKSTPSKTSVANEPIKAAIFEYLVANGTKTTAEIAKGVAVLEGSSPKASAMCRQMVEEGRLTPSDVSVKGKGKQKAYTAIVE